MKFYLYSSNFPYLLVDINFGERLIVISTVKTSVATHDTTGGMMTKIAEAAVIAKLGINVYIVKVKY